MSKTPFTWLELIKMKLKEEKDKGNSPSIRDVVPEAKKDWAQIKEGKHPKYIQGKAKTHARKKNKGENKKSRKNSMKSFKSSSKSSSNSNSNSNFGNVSNVNINDRAVNGNNQKIRTKSKNESLLQLFDLLLELLCELGFWVWSVPVKL